MDEPIQLPIDGVLDLHTFNPREIKDLVPDYLAECQERGILQVRIIHGKGIGNIKRTVHSILSKHPEVVSFALDHPQFGGWGATLVQLRPKVIIEGEKKPQMRLILLGNAGAGKSTMAHRVIGSADIPRLSLDEIAWDPGTKRKPLDESRKLLRQFINASEQWVIEGCYGDLIEAALPYCTELRFLNPGVETCVAHCNRRPWEPSKFSSAEQQDAMLTQLIQWVQEYETREDDYGLKRHRQIFDGFSGPKHEYTSTASYEG